MTPSKVPGAEICVGGVPGPRLYELRRAVIGSALIEQIEARYRDALARVASRTGRRDREVERIASAWSSRCELVGEALHAVAPAIRSAYDERNGPAAQLDHPIDATLFVVSGGSGDGTHAHQDLAYKWDRPDDRYAYTTWVAISSCDEQTGALRFSDALPRDPISPRQDFLRAGFVDLATTAAWLERESAVCMQRGDVVLFDACTWHSSQPFRGRGRRLSLAVRWTSAGRWERSISVPRPDQDPTAFGMDTSGSLLGSALRAASGLAPALSPEEKNLRKTLASFWESDRAGAQLGRQAKLALEDLTLALELLEDHGARPAAHVWRAIRDDALPELLAITKGGAR